jgi:hypothetical protein
VPTEHGCGLAIKSKQQASTKQAADKQQDTSSLL